MSAEIQVRLELALKNYLLAVQAEASSPLAGVAIVAGHCSDIQDHSERIVCEAQAGRDRFRCGNHQIPVSLVVITSALPAPGEVGAPEERHGRRVEKLAERFAKARRAALLADLAAAAAAQGIALDAWHPGERLTARSNECYVTELPVLFAARLV